LEVVAVTQFGHTLYSIYGSTEVGLVSIVTPDDLRAAPDTAGRPALPPGPGRRDDRFRRGERVPAGGRGVLARHPAVAEAAAIGVPDLKFGQRLRAFVVLVPGTSVNHADATRLA
jgi:fatty-acyl-CoA synthase